LDKEILLTEDGFKKMEEELEYLKTVRRRAVAERIKQAIEFGDISENSEYEDAKNEQAFIEGTIMDLEKKLRNVKIIDTASDTAKIKKTVTIGSTVRIINLETEKESEYTIVGSVEADPKKRKISNESPIGKALLGARVGKTLEVTVPKGILKLKIVAISNK